MDWKSALEIIGAAIVSVGGAGSIIYAVAKGLASRIADRMLEKFKAENQYKFDRLMAEYQTVLEKQKHASEVFFDTEFKAYEELNIKFNEMINAVFSLYPVGLNIGKKMDTDEELEQDCNEKIQFASEKYNDANSMLSAKAIYISEEIYSKFEALLKMAYRQIIEYYSLNPYYMKKEHDSEIMKEHRECVNRTKQLDDDWNSLVNELRNNLKSYSIRRNENG